MIIMMVVIVDGEGGGTVMMVVMWSYYFKREFNTQTLGSHCIHHGTCRIIIAIQ